MRNKEQEMARGNLAACLKVTLRHEGGWSDHPRDPGGATMKGVTLATYRRYHPGAGKAELRAISDAQVQEIYRDGFWNAVAAESLPHGVDLVTFDAAVNSGPGRAAKWLQIAVGAKPDGKVGPQTLRLIAEPKALIQRLSARRLGFVQGLRTWAVFGRGWRRRIADVEAQAVAMWLAHAGSGDVSGDVSGALAREAEAARRRAQNQAAGAAGTVATGSLGTAAGAVSPGTSPWLIAALAAAIILLATIQAAKAWQNRQRAAAYQLLSHTS
jgi:lysozyme family protein